MNNKSKIASGVGALALGGIVYAIYKATSYESILSFTSMKF